VRVLRRLIVFGERVLPISAPREHITPGLQWIGPMRSTPACVFELKVSEAQRVLVLEVPLLLAMIRRGFAARLRIVGREPWATADANASARTSARLAARPARCRPRALPRAGPLPPVDPPRDRCDAHLECASDNRSRFALRGGRGPCQGPNQGPARAGHRG
jgi:hypothetical protein